MVLLASARAVAAVQVGAGSGKVIGAQQGAGRGIPSAEGGRKRRSTFDCYYGRGIMNDVRGEMDGEGLGQRAGGLLVGLRRIR